MRKAARKMSVLLLLSWTAAAPRLNRSCGGASSSSSMLYRHLRVGDVLSRDIPDYGRHTGGISSPFPGRKKKNTDYVPYTNP